MIKRINENKADNQYSELDIGYSACEAAKLFSCLSKENQDTLLGVMREMLGTSKYDKYSEIEIDSYESEYFEDMMFEPHSVVDEFIKYTGSDRAGVSHEAYDDYHMGLLENGFNVYIKDLDEDIGGQTDRKNKSIFINSNHSDDKATVLHEMIHAHEVILESRESFYHDILLLCLYNDLKGKISDIDAKILAHTHAINGEIISEQGGSHDVLFLLKSLDLDLRCGFELGTVCGYGRQELFNSHAEANTTE